MTAPTPVLRISARGRGPGPPWHMIHHNPSQNQPEILDQTIDNTLYNTIRRCYSNIRWRLSPKLLSI
jgi:hypothetical protein